MTRTEQAAFVRELSTTIANSIVHQIRTGSIPDTWDGHELRELLAYRHKQSAGIGAMGRTRKREFNNVVLVNNL